MFTRNGKGLLFAVVLGATGIASAVHAQEPERLAPSAASGFGCGPIMFTLLDAARLERPVRAAQPVDARAREGLNDAMLAAQAKTAPPAAVETMMTPSSGLMFAVAQVSPQNGASQTLMSTVASAH